MLRVTELEAESVKNAIKRSIIFPEKLDYLQPGEIHSLHFNESKSFDYVLIYNVSFGTLKHWLHDQETLKDYGFAHPHELADHLKRLYKDRKFNDEHEIWTKTYVQYIFHWGDYDPVKMQNAVMRIQYFTDYNESLQFEEMKK